MYPLQSSSMFCDAMQKEKHGQQTVIKHAPQLSKLRRIKEKDEHSNFRH